MRDQAVRDASGWPHDWSDADNLARLLGMNGERAAAHGRVAVVKAPRDDENDEQRRWA